MKRIHALISRGVLEVFLAFLVVSASLPQAQAVTMIALNNAPKHSEPDPGWNTDKEVDAGAELAVRLTFEITDFVLGGSLTVEGFDAWGQDQGSTFAISGNGNWTTSSTSRYSNITRVYCGVVADFMIQVYQPETEPLMKTKYILIGSLLFSPIMLALAIRYRKNQKS